MKHLIPTMFHLKNNTDSGNNNNNNTSKGFSEVAFCSYEARAMGIRNGTLLKNALVKCPDLVCLPYQFDDYRETSMVIYGILSESVDLHYNYN